ncbi:MAG: DUF6941 family protein [Dehalococcoidia bacterium]
MDLDSVIIADYADITGGKLYLMGGGWDTTTVQAVPAQVRMAVAVGVRIGWEETNRPIPVRITVVDDDMQELVRLEAQVNVGRPPNLLPGSTQLAQVAVNLVVNAQHGGGHAVTVRAGDGADAVERTLPFRVVVRPQSAPPTS